LGESAALFSPIDAWSAYSASDDAQDAAEKKYPTLPTDNNERDAFRHALWSYKMAKDLGAEAAKEFGDAHERDSAPDGVRLMDLHNNLVGRELAADPANRQRPDEDVIDDAIKNGFLKLEPFRIAPY
jgi:hypothetical protein